MSRKKRKKKDPPPAMIEFEAPLVAEAPPLPIPPPPMVDVVVQVPAGAQVVEPHDGIAAIHPRPNPVVCKACGSTKVKQTSHRGKKYYYECLKCVVVGFVPTKFSIVRA